VQARFIVLGVVEANIKALQCKLVKAFWFTIILDSSFKVPLIALAHNATGKLGYCTAGA